MDSLENKSGKRKRGNHPKEATDILMDWLIIHRDVPFPTTSEKQILAEKTGLNFQQVSDWFINARRRVLDKILEKYGPGDSSTNSDSGGEMLRRDVDQNVLDASYSLLNLSLEKDEGVCNTKSKRQRMDSSATGQNLRVIYSLYRKYINGNKKYVNGNKLLALACIASFIINVSKSN